MPTLALVIRNPSGDAAVSLIGLVIVALVAAMLVALWVFVAAKAAHPENVDAEDPGLARLRRWKLVVKRPRSVRASNAVVVSQLDQPNGGSGPAPR
ncbi:MAG TPA: hypothetical protein VFE13_01090 [Caulobacteraceae bacterium]|jgi:hypothetical protein|nr:hypothetical protein [Caulobacteraceae bacterium]